MAPKERYVDFMRLIIGQGWFSLEGEKNISICLVTSLYQSITSETKIALAFPGKGRFRAGGLDGYPHSLWRS